jgi:membrane protein implicated in regulation of membrane protease activity
LLNSKVILKYTLLHLVELGLLIVVLAVVRYFINVPIWLIITILALWILKDIVLFRKVWRAYAMDDNHPMRRLVGLEATVVDGLDPVGYVRVQGELWKAEIKDPGNPARRGDRTRVVDIKGMTLIVEMYSDREPQRSRDGVPG